MQSAHVRQLRDAKAEMPEAANSRLKALRALFAWAVEAEHVANNPAKQGPKLKKHSEGSHTWTLEEVRASSRRSTSRAASRAWRCGFSSMRGARAGRTWCAWGAR